MTETRDSRRKAITRWVWTGLLLAPPVVLWCLGAYDAAHHKSPTDWQTNHATKLAFEHAFLLILGAPAVGALLGGCYGVVRRSADPGATVAGGALLGAVGLWAYGAYELGYALTHITIVF
ncbi:hypothetical protein OG607_28760 [Streptomyces sp. NBC_01537]|uniref:hypothetical protein n=1 Tax=Streptomyces sp. NBC_01537 TaxID=2903896 RepID=UPI00386B01D7